MGKSLSTTFTQANGVPAQIAGGPAWEAISGAAPTVSSNELLFSTAGSLHPVYGVTVGVRGLNGKADAEVSALPKHVYGNAVYLRMVDANNWVRARVLSDYQDNYVTEYQHTAYITEYLWDKKEYRDSYQGKKLQRQVQTATTTTVWTMGAWSAWSTYDVTPCRSTAPTVANGSLPANVVGQSGNEIQQYQAVSQGSGVGCAAGNAKYNKQTRTRTESSGTQTSYTYRYVDDGYVCGANESFTGTTQVVNTSTYFKVGTAGTQSTTADGPYDVFLSTTVYSYGTTYWAATAAGPADTQVSPQQTRQTANGTYWDTTFESGAPTRQTYVSTTVFPGYVYLEKRVAGAISVLGTYYSGSSTPQILRLRAKGSALQVYYGGTLRITATDAAFDTTGTKVGLGGGPSFYNPTVARLDDFSYTLLTPIKIRNAAGTAWIDVERPRLRIGGEWVDYDPKKY